MNRFAKWIVRGVLLAAGLFFLIFGLLNEGFRDVMNKAVVVCLECIGIG